MKIGAHALEVPAHTRLCVVGVPYLVFDHEDGELSFEWTGNYQDPIEVTPSSSPGITNLIEYTVDHRPLLPTDSLEPLPQFFERTCREWVERIGADIGAVEPRMVWEV